MKKLLALWCGMLLVTGWCFAADMVEGFYISIDEKTGKPTAGWEVYVTGDALYGKILSLFEKSQDELAAKCKDSYPGFPVAGKVTQMKVVGSPWIFGLKMDKPGQWSGGSIIDPNDGKMYKCKMTYHQADGKRYKTDTLEMRGEIGLGIGRSQYWQQATREQANALR
ncbi:MAG: DUF2147 domain-containing protein [Treponema sp.]|nr:DUF2147 domain-containing protein [Treponema sp.]